MGVTILTDTTETVHIDEICSFLKEKGYENKFYIYMHRNLINDKIYIGQTNNPKRRWRLNGREYQPNKGNESRFWNAIKKYGWENFSHKILVICDTRDEANEVEIEYIKKYQSYLKDKGYNIVTDGKGQDSFFYKLTKEQQEEYRKKCSIRSKKKLGKC